MPVFIVGIVFGSFLLLMKMILDHRKQTYLPPRVNEGSSMMLSELNDHIQNAVQEAIEPLVARIDELESAQLLSTSETMLLSEDSRTTSGERKEHA